MIHKKLRILIILIIIASIEIAFLVYQSEGIFFNEKVDGNIENNKVNSIEVLENKVIEEDVMDYDDLMSEDNGEGDADTEEIINDEVDDENIKSEEAVLEDEVNIEKLIILIDVPFTPQAPFINWDDPIYQDGCEEATSFMAVSWARGVSFDSIKANNEIALASSYQEENYGDYRDTSAKDTLTRIINGYFAYDKAEIKINIKISDIILELINGNIVILPMNGQKLGNPYYNPPGPERHMIIVIGYDEEVKEFIVNDPGTKRGKNYRYSEDVLFNAIRDYSTGFHEEIEGAKKTMIVVRSEYNNNKTR